MTQISPANFRRRLTLALVLPLVLMSFSAVSFIWQVNNLTKVMHWVDHTDRVVARANHTQKLLVDMETGLRGYLVTGTSEFLEPYEQAQLLINSDFNQLARLVSTKPSQGKRLQTVRSLYEQWNRYAQQMIALKKRGGDYQSYALNIQGKQKMDALRGQVASFIQAEEKLRVQRTHTVQQTTQFAIITSIVLLLAIAIILAFFIRQQLVAVSQSYGRTLKNVQEQADALREREETLRRSAQRLASLHQIDRDILQAHSPNELVSAALSRMSQLVPCHQAFVVLFNFETRKAQVVPSQVNGDSQDATLPLEDFVATEALPRETHYVEDIATADSYPLALRQVFSEGTGSYISVPLLVQENLIGELYLVTTQKAAFSAEHREISEEVAAQLAIALHQANLREQLQHYTAELEQRVAERTQKLQEANTELEAFSYSVSHDLRAPLRTLQGFTQALQEDYGDKLNTIGQEYAHYIVESAVQMDTLISDLLAYSRLSRTEIQLQPVDLSSVLAQVLNQLNAELQERQALVTVEPSLPQVIAHRTTLIQVLTNLLSNALKFVEPGVQPRVRVWAEEVEEEEGEENSQPPVLSSPSKIRLWVEDNGIGIAPEYHDRIFRVFERLHGVETYPGTGIGLAIVRKGMERLGGRVGIESQQGEGSRFWIELQPKR